MLSLYRTVSYRFMRLRWSRAALIVVSIMLGVALLVSTRILIQSMQEGTKVALNPFAHAADLIVLNGDTGVPGELADELDEAHIRGLERIEPLVIGDGGYSAPGDKGVRVRLIGFRIDLQNRLKEMHDQTQGALEIQLDHDSKVKVEPGMVRSGDHSSRSWNEVVTWPIIRMIWSEQRVPVIVGHKLAARFPDDSGKFCLHVYDRPYDLMGVGTVTAEGDAAFLSDNTVLMRYQDASRIVFPEPQRQGFVSRIHLIYSPGANPAAVREQVNEVLKGRARAVTPDENDLAIQDVTAALEVGFTLIAYLALLVGLFLVYISLTVSVAERRPDIGVLRSLGATRFQIGALFAGEAIFLGVLAAVLGIPLGWGLAQFAISPIQQVMSDLFTPVEAHSLTLSRGTILLALSSGMATALIAALVPAMQAAQEQPADAVRRLPFRNQKLLRLLYIGGCAGMVLFGIGLLLMRRALPDRVGGFGGIIAIMLGAMSATPLITGYLSSLVQPIASSVLGLHGRLAADNLGRSPGRTGLVIAVLAAGVALIIETAGLKEGTEAALLGWIDEKIPADLFVSAYAPVSTQGSALPMDERRAAELADDPELKDKIDQVVAYYIHPVDFRNKIVLIVAFDADRAYQAMETRPAVPGSELFPRLYQEKNVVLVSENFAAQHNVHVGEHIELLSRKGEKLSFKVIGTIDDYTWNRGSIFMDRGRFKDDFGVAQVDLFHVYVRNGKDHQALVEEVRDTIRRKGADSKLFVLSRSEFREELRKALRALYRISYAQLLIVALVVSLGVVSALLISVLQRRRELGLIRAVGATRGHVVMMVLSEAILMGIFGSLMGLAVGIPLHWMALHVLLLEETGFVFPFLIPWREAGIVIGIALVISAIAGLIPALRAMRLNIAESIAYE
jgi:putative ABC transport system permease protein